MFDLINGLPIHPLVVHAVVVLLPLSIVGAIALVFVPRWRRSHGLLVLSVAALATALIPVATSSGEELEHHVGDPGRHAHLGDQLIWFALPLLVLLIALVWLDRRLPESNGLHRAVAGLLVVAALAAGFQTYRVGDTGARAAWGDQVTAKASS